MTAFTCADVGRPELLEERSAITTAAPAITATLAIQTQRGTSPSGEE